VNLIKHDRSAGARREVLQVTTGIQRPTTGCPLPPTSRYQSAEDDARRRLGRGLTREELERILWHYPGDVVERRER